MFYRETLYREVMGAQYRKYVLLVWFLDWLRYWEECSLTGGAKAPICNGRNTCSDLTNVFNSVLSYTRNSGPKESMC